jgi:hypothetical protein
MPGGVQVLTPPSMSAMHRAMERQDYAEALAQLRMWAGLLGVDGERAS